MWLITEAFYSTTKRIFARDHNHHSLSGTCANQRKSQLIKWKHEICGPNNVLLIPIVFPGSDNIDKLCVRIYSWPIVLRIHSVMCCSFYDILFVRHHLHFGKSHGFYTPHSKWSIIFGSQFNSIINPNWCSFEVIFIQLNKLPNLIWRWSRVIENDLDFFPGDNL